MEQTSRLPTGDRKTYSAATLVPLIETMKERGIAVEKTLQGTSLRDTDLTKSTQVSIDQIVRLYRNCVELVEDPSFAFQAGLRAHVSSYGLYGFAILSCSTVEQALGLIQKYNEAAYPLSSVAVRTEGDTATISVYPFIAQQEDEKLYRFYVNFRMGNYLTGFRDIVGGGFSATRVRVAYREVTGASPQTALPGCAIDYAAPENEFVFDASWLTRPLQLANPVSNAQLLKLCDQLLEDFEQHSPFTLRVQGALLSSLGRPLAFTELCARLALSPRTLRRKLKEEGTSYGDLLANLRARVATKYLQETQLSVEEIALVLGFSEAANFRRFLRSRTGRGPNEIRQDAEKPRSG